MCRLVAVSCEIWQLAHSLTSLPVCVWRCRCVWTSPIKTKIPPSGSHMQENGENVVKSWPRWGQRSWKQLTVFVCHIAACLHLMQMVLEGEPWESAGPNPPPPHTHTHSSYVWIQTQTPVSLQKHFNTWTNPTILSPAPWATPRGHSNTSANSSQTQLWNLC